MVSLTTKSCIVQMNADTWQPSKNREVVGSQPTWSPAPVLKLVKNIGNSTGNSTGNRQLLHTSIFTVENRITLKYSTIINSVSIKNLRAGPELESTNQSGQSTAALCSSWGQEQAQLSLAGPVHSSRLVFSTWPDSQTHQAMVYQAFFCPRI